MQLPVLINYKDEIYRPAGYRKPNWGELYVAKDGHIKRAITNATEFREARLIVRVYNPEDFNGAQR